MLGCGGASEVAFVFADWMVLHGSTWISTLVSPELLPQSSASDGVCDDGPSCGGVCVLGVCAAAWMGVASLEAENGELGPPAEAAAELVLVSPLRWLDPPHLAARITGFRARVGNCRKTQQVKQIVFAKNISIPSIFKRS